VTIYSERYLRDGVMAQKIVKILPSCHFDNPYSLRREFWVNGEVVSWISSESIMQAGGSYMIGMFTGWKSGYIDGDPQAFIKEAVLEDVQR
jgi:hypothetical protein